MQEPPAFRPHESPQRAEILREVAARVLELPATQIARVAIDGVDGAGKTVFADELASGLAPSRRPIIRASVDGFHNPRAIRYARGRGSPEGFYFDSYDYAALRRSLLDPLGPEGSRVYRTAAFDHLTDSPVAAEAHLAAPNAILVIDGIFLHRPELSDCWDLSMFLSVPFEVSIPRGAARGPGFGSADPAAESNRRYVNGQRLYLDQQNPQDRADIVVDNTDLAAPKILHVRGSARPAPGV
jgi:uridine kinase